MAANKQNIIIPPPKPKTPVKQQPRNKRGRSFQPSEPVEKEEKIEKKLPKIQNPFDS